MTKPVSRKMAVDCLLYCFEQYSVWDPVWQQPILKCPECKDPIRPGQTIQFDHRHSDAMGGPHEYMNLRPIHYDPCHKKKTGRDVAALAKVDRITLKTKTGPKAKIPGKPIGKRPPGAGNGFPPKGSTPMRRKP